MAAYTLDFNLTYHILVSERVGSDFCVVADMRGFTMQCMDYSYLKKMVGTIYGTRTHSGQNNSLDPKIRDGMIYDSRIRYDILRYTVLYFIVYRREKIS